MKAEQLAQVVAEAIGSKRLLDHPFYQRWTKGELTLAELASYAEQYRHVEAALPSVLETVVSGLPPGAARDATAANLADEVGNPAPHVEIFESFAAAVGARPGAAATPATEALVALQKDAAARGAAVGLSVLSAYESQAAEIAASKSEGLARNYGIDAAGTAFWDLHAALEDDHAGWSFEALAEMGADEDEVSQAAREAARAWWAFLDEREAAAA